MTCLNSIKTALFILVVCILSACTVNELERTNNTASIDFQANSSSYGIKTQKDKLIYIEKKTGEEKSLWNFYDDGKLRSHYKYINGVMVKDALEYFPDGALAFYKYYDSRGRLAYMRSYNENGNFKDESGELITFNEQEIAVKNDSIFVSVHTPRPPGTSSACTVIFFNDGGNTTDSLSFNTSDFALSLSMLTTSKLLFKAELTEPDYSSYHTKSIAISEIKNIALSNN